MLFLIAGLLLACQSADVFFVVWRAAPQKFGKTPLLIDDEMEAQYKMVYNRAMARHDTSAEINLVRSSLPS